MAISRPRGSGPLRSQGVGRSQAIGVEGFRELRGDLRDLDRGLPKMMATANQEAAEWMAEKARLKASSFDDVSTKTVKSIRATKDQTAAVLKFGGARVPQAMGQNFGSYHDLSRRSGTRTVAGWNQFPEWGGNQWISGDGDRFIYKVVQENHDEFFLVFADSLENFLRSVGHWKGGSFDMS